MAPIAQLDKVKHSSVLGGSALNSTELELILRALYLVQIFDHFLLHMRLRFLCTSLEISSMKMKAIIVLLAIVLI